MTGTEISKNIINFLGTNLNNISTSEFVDFVISHAKIKKKIFITYLNAHCANHYFKDKEYADIIDKADVVYADGMGIVYASKYLGTPLKERVNAGDFFIDFCKRCEKEGLSLYFLGTKSRFLKRAKENIQEKVAGVKIVGTHDGYFSKEESNEIVDNINSLKPDILVIGMGIPYQEKWLSENFEKLDVPICWCVGALFDYFGGEFFRAPVLMRKLGLEWLFRLILEPRRMWKRYMIGNFTFINRVIEYKKESIGRNNAK